MEPAQFYFQNRPLNCFTLKTFLVFKYELTFFCRCKLLSRDARTGGAGVSPNFCRSVNRGMADYAHQIITTGTPKFFHLPASLLSSTTCKPTQISPPLCKLHPHLQGDTSRGFSLESYYSAGQERLIKIFHGKQPISNRMLNNIYLIK